MERAIEKAVDQMAAMIGKGFAHSDKRFDTIEAQLGKREHLLFQEQERKIDDLEQRMKKPEDALAV